VLEEIRVLRGGDRLHHALGNAIVGKQVAPLGSVVLADDLATLVVDLGGDGELVGADLVDRGEIAAEPRRASAPSHRGGQDRGDDHEPEELHSLFGDCSARHSGLLR